MVSNEKTIGFLLNRMKIGLALDWPDFCLYMAIKKVQPHLHDLSHWGFTDEQTRDVFSFDWQKEWEIFI